MGSVPQLTGVPWALLDFPLGSWAYHLSSFSPSTNLPSKSPWGLESSAQLRLHLGLRWLAGTLFHLESQPGCRGIDFGCQFDIFGKRDPQLRNGCHRFGLWTCEALSYLILDVRGPNPLWAVPSLCRQAWALAEQAKESKALNSSPLRPLLQGAAFSSCLGFP